VSRPSATVHESPGRIGRPVQHLMALGAVAVTLIVVGALDAAVPGLQTLVLLYVVPITVAATCWGFGPAITAALASALGHDVLFIEPVGSLTIGRTDEAIGLVLLLFTAMVTSQLAVMARHGADRAREAEVARRSDTLKTALLRAVSHDLRTPLASIKASVSGLRQPEAHYSEDDQAELLAVIEEEADRLTRLVTYLLDASRLEAGVLTPDRRGYDLAELVDAVVRRLQPLIGDRPLDVEIDLARRVVTRAGVGVHLTPTEYCLLRYFAQHPGRVITHGQLLRAVLGPGYEDASGNLRVYIAGLRKKLEPDPSQPRLLITEPGVGYRLDVD
jgi:K+-sensing histidine kinase KdpD